MTSVFPLPMARDRVLRRDRLIGWSLALLSAALWLLALPVRAGNLPGELPALVGRLSALSGDVRWFDRDSGDWVQSSETQPLRNWPLAPGDRLRTGAGGRAELHIGSTTLRLGAHAELWLPRLDEQAVLLHLQAGSLAVRLADVDRDGFGPVEMLTREGRWLPQRPGHYRLDRERDATQASAWRGELRFESRDSALNISAGRRADLWQDGGGTTRYAFAGVERDGFADWVARDERQDDAPQSARYVPPGMTGWQDLDRHGDWIDDQQQGMVWQPRVVAPGWVPFHDGRWAWVAPWGWTWIDAAPWGFAPFHYGVWLTVGGRWSWSPGPRHQPPRYAPALNAWVSRPHIGVNIQIGNRPPPPRVIVPVVVVRPAPRPIIVLPREPADRDHRGPRNGRDGDRRDGSQRDERRPDERRPDERRGDDRRGDDRRPDDRRADDPRGNDPRGNDPRGNDPRGNDPRGDNRRPYAPRFDGPRREDRRSDADAPAAQRPAEPERPMRQAPMAGAPLMTTVVPPPISQPAPPRAAEPPAAEAPHRGLPTPVGRGAPREPNEAREARSPRAERPERPERPERVERSERPERRIDDARRERDNTATTR